MKKVKKQSIAIAMVTALSAGAIMSPASVYAQQKESPSQISDSVATPKGNNMLLEADNNAFTDEKIASQAIKDALAAYEFTNQTTTQEAEQEVKEFLEQEFVNTGKISSINYVALNRTIEATQDAPGEIECVIRYILVEINGVDMMWETIGTYVIPRLPKDEGVAIDKVNFPDPIFRQYVIDKFDNNPKDQILNQQELNQINELRIDAERNITDLTGIEYMKNLATLTCRETGIEKLNIRENTALTYINCGDTKISELDVKNNTLLTNLYLSNTFVEDLDISNNAKLEYLGCSNTKIHKLDVGKKDFLKWLYCAENENLTSLILDGAKALEYLECDDNQKLESLNIKSNSKLNQLYCYSTQISHLDVSGNPELINLNIANTLIKEIDVSMLPKLENLWTWKTNIPFLDLSKNPLLKSLYTPDTNLAYLDWGNANLTKLYMDSSSIVNLITNSESFDITEVFKGIDINKIDDLKNASISKEGIISQYNMNIPITYTYKCGRYNDNPVSLNVTINLMKKDSTITIAENLNKEYTGEPYKNPEVTTVGSSGELTFTYYDMNGDNPVKLDKAPTNVGKYAVYIELAEDENYYGAVIELEEFEITKSKNDWINKPTITGWTYGEKANSPTAKAKFGDVSFTYSNAKDGTYTKDVPTNIGTYYVKATVLETENYTGLEMVKSFKISRAVNAWINEPTITDWTYGEQANKPTAKAKFGDVSFTYSNAKDGTYTKDVPTNIGTYYVKAIVPETENYTGLEMVKSFKISKAVNTWINEPTITDWTYGEQANKPTAKAKFGDVTFTYSDSENGQYTDQVPTNAGTYYVKANVAETNAYTGLNSIVKFTVHPKKADDNTDIIIPDINNDSDVDNLVIKDGDKELINGTDYEVEKKVDGNKTDVIITFIGNYTGTVIKSYTEKTVKEETKTTNKTPTGDNSSIGLFGMIGLLSVGCIAFMTGKKKEEK